MKFLRIFSRVLLGLLFIFSGYVKAIDPIGSQLIFAADFEAFHMSFMIPLAMEFGVLLSTVELVLGFCLLMGLRMVITAWATVFFMGFMTLLTLVLAVFNPVTDCGCFGEAIKLTNWETFFKNIVFDIFVVIVFVERKKYLPLSNCRNEWITTGAFAVLTVLLSIYSYRHLPLIDFLPYKVGVNIQEAMEIPEGAPVDEYETKLIYEKPGEGRQSFTLENYPKDTSWKFVEAVNVLKKKGYEPPIVDFTINSPYSGYITDSVLNLPGYLFLATLPHAEEASLSHVADINRINDYVLTHEGLHFIGLSGSDDDYINTFARQSGCMYPIYITDEKPLKSMVRSNPGLMLLHNGTIIAKWSHFDIPGIEKLENKYLKQNPDELITGHQTKQKLTSELLVVVAFVVMIMLAYCFRKYRKNADTTTRELSA